MDAVGRTLTTDAQLCALTTCEVAAGYEIQQALGVAVQARADVANWSSEFGRLVEEFLEVDQRDRLGFYLIDLICWFKDFTQNASCTKLDCEPLRPGTLQQAVYLLELEGAQRVLILAQRVDKTHPNFLQPLGE